MDLKLGAAIYTASDDKQVGKLRLVVLERQNNTFSGLIVDRSHFGHHDVIISAQDVATISPDGDRIDLKLSEAQLDTQPTYQEANYAAPDDDSKYDADPEPSEDPTRKAGIPLGFGAFGSADLAFGAGQLYAPAPLVVYPEQTVAGSVQDDVQWEAGIQAESSEENLLDQDTPVIGEGARVQDRDGTTVGHVSRVQTDSIGKLTTLVIKEGVLFTKEVMIQADWIDDLTESLIVLKYSQDEIKARLGG